MLTLVTIYCFTSKCNVAQIFRLQLQKYEDAQISTYSDVVTISIPHPLNIGDHAYFGSHYFLTKKIGRAPRILTYGNVMTMENPHFFKIGDKAYFGYQGAGLFKKYNIDLEF